MMIASILYLAGLAAAVPAAFPGKGMDSSNCGCYLTNGSNPKYYSEHMFYDFRSLNEYAGVPAVDTNPDSSSTSPSSDYFKKDNWANTWQLSSWNNKKPDGTIGNNAKLLMVHRPNNVYIQKNEDNHAGSNTFLTLRTKRLPGFQTASEVASKSGNYHFISLRMLARTIGSPGACTAFFTYRPPTGSARVQEADMEILTRDPRNMIQYTNQPGYSDDGTTYPQATRNATIPSGLPWTEWAVHRLDWTPERSIWYVNGVEIANIEFQTPRDPSYILLNAWSDGGLWTGMMPEYDEAYLQIQWMEMVYNTASAKQRRAEKEQCAVVCSIDKGEPGVPTVM